MSDILYLDGTTIFYFILINVKKIQFFIYYFHILYFTALYFKIPIFTNLIIIIIFISFIIKIKAT